MSAPLNLDLDVLRTFVTGLDLGSYAKAAQRLGRSQSAISLQLRKLEEQTGQTLLRKQGRGLALTEPGEIMLGYARRLLEVNDEALAALKGASLQGPVRLGLPQDFAESWLPDVLGRFSRANPHVRVEARVDPNAALLDALGRGDLDLAVTWNDGADAARCREELARLPMVWIGKPGFRRNGSDPVPLVLFEPPCIFRRHALAALDDAGIAWRIAFAGPSLSGLWAAVSAGLGITVRTPEGLPSGLAALNAKRADLPALKEIGLNLCTSEGAAASPAVMRLQALLRERLQASLSSGVSRRRAAR
jgi:DNA-binding transcriptional LysR family regulator